MELVKPSEKYLESYYRGCVETWGHVQDNYILHNPDEYESWKTTIFDDYDNQEKGIGLPEGFVPSVTFWLVDDDEYLGTVNIRLELTDSLIEYCGNCGFVVRLSKRGHGVGVKLAKLAIDKMRELDIKPVLMTCEEDNEVSWRTIEKLGYKKREKYTTTLNGKFFHARRYWV